MHPLQAKEGAEKSRQVLVSGHTPSESAVLLTSKLNELFALM